MHTIREIGSHHRQRFGLQECFYDILYDGVGYRCDADTLARLYDGVPLDECDVIPLDKVKRDD